MRICIVSHDATYANAAGLAAALSDRFDVKCILFRKDPKKMYKQFDCDITTVIPKADEYIISAAHTLRILGDKLDGKRAKIILNDTTYLKNWHSYNKIISRNHWEPWAMPDLQYLCPGSKVYYQPFKINIPIEKYKNLTICHSPFSESKFKQKGTEEIKRIVKRFDCDFKLIVGKTWRECLEIKSHCHIFIDQLYQGIGMSGMEAMFLKCLVLTGKKPHTDYLPPVIWINENTLESKLDYYINHGFENEVKQSCEWAQENLTYDAVSKRLYPY